MMKISDTHIPPHLAGKTASADGHKAATPTDTASIELSPGQLVKGVVTGITEDGKILLNIAGQSLKAISMVPLEPGRELWLEVGRGGNPPTVFLAGKKGAVQEFFRLFLANSQFFQQGKATLLSEVSSFLADNSDNALLGKTLLTAILSATQDGQASPQSVRILTALLGANSMTAQGKETDILKSAPFIDAVRQSISSHQEINQQPLLQDTENFFLFPCFFSGQSGWGEWLFSMEKQNKAAAEHYRLSFFLEMTHLGPVTLMASIQDKAIHGEFTLQTEKARQHLSVCLDELVTTLKTQGYTTVMFSCLLGKKELIQHFKETLEKKTGTEHFALVDIRI